MTGDPGGGGDGRVMWDYGNFTATRGSYGIFSSQQSGDNATALMNFSGYTGGGFTITRNVPFIISHSYVGGSEIESNDIRLNNSVPTYTVPKGAYPGGGGNQTLDTWTTSGTTEFYVGAPTQIGFAYRFSGAIAEILLFNEAHDAATQAGVNQYLANKYGISI
jgi:hypothetical protein